MGRVFLHHLEDYSMDALIPVIDNMLESGGVYKKLERTKRVVIKPNLVMRSSPEDGIITHPNVVSAVALCVKRHGANVLVAESGGGVYNTSVMKSVFRGCGYTAAAEKYGFELYTDCAYRQAELADGIRCNALDVIEPYLRPHDSVIINIAKLKTHGMLGYSGAVKNLFGTVPGLMKPELHCRYPEKDAFAEMIVDLCEYIRPDFSVIDGIYAMQGDGPTGGERRFVGALIGSESPYDADIVGTALIGMEPTELPIQKNAFERRLCGKSVSDIELLGESISSLYVADFKPARSSDVDFLKRVPGFLRPLAKKLTTPYPKIRVGSCVGCGKCAESCPQHTITIRGERACIDYSRCIKCFCCHEMCPKHVIDIKRFSIFRL